MKIKEIINQCRRDFEAIYICESCDNEEFGSGYDDANFHENVIPKMKCKSCEESAPKDYRNLPTKYEAHEVV